MKKKVDFAYTDAEELLSIRLEVSATRFIEKHDKTRKKKERPVKHDPELQAKLLAEYAAEREAERLSEIEAVAERRRKALAKRDAKQRVKPGSKFRPMLASREELEAQRAVICDLKSYLRSKQQELGDQ